MASIRDIRRRIKGVRATGKITRAMEMISAVKMRKAVAAVLAIRPYAENVVQVLHQLAKAGGDHALLEVRPVERALYVVITSNRGLCGAFNSQIVKRLRLLIQEDQGREAFFLTIGKKGDAAVRRLVATSAQPGSTILASFPDVLATPSAQGMRPIAKLLIEAFESKKVDRVVMVYTDFKSMLAQEVKVRALLPVVEKDVQKALNEIEHGAIKERVMTAEYVIEPSPKKVLWKMIPRLIEMELYHAILESNASQESARMLAMRNATDAGKEMAASLTFMYNQIRQSKITQEIAELSAGMAAVSK